MGGNKDKSGHVDAKKLIEVLKNEFEMSIDIEVIFLSLTHPRNLSKKSTQMDREKLSLTNLRFYCLSDKDLIKDSNYT